MILIICPETKEEAEERKKEEKPHRTEKQTSFMSIKSTVFFLFYRATVKIKFITLLLTHIDNVQTNFNQSILAVERKHIDSNNSSS